MRFPTRSAKTRILENTHEWARMGATRRETGGSAEGLRAYPGHSIARQHSMTPPADGFTWTHAGTPGANPGKRAVNLAATGRQRYDGDIITQGKGVARSQRGIIA